MIAAFSCSYLNNNDNDIIILLLLLFDYLVAFNIQFIDDESNQQFLIQYLKLLNVLFYKWLTAIKLLLLWNSTANRYFFQITIKPNLIFYVV